MTKRFTDTDKWNDAWFAELPADKYKWFWLYYLDKCDVAGIFKERLDIFSMLTGHKITHDEIMDIFKDRIYFVRSGVYFCPKFIKFQNINFYDSGLTAPQNNSHKGIHNSLKQHGVLDKLNDFGILQTNPPKGTLQRPPSNSNSNSNSNSKGNSNQKTEINAPDNNIALNIPTISEYINEMGHSFRSSEQKNVFSRGYRQQALKIADEIKKESVK
jgi:hypothetical protein